MITFYKTQEDVAQALKHHIDEYWALKVEEQRFIDNLSKIVKNNKAKIFKDGGFTTLVRQRLGKKRTDLIKKIMKRGLID